MEGYVPALVTGGCGFVGRNLVRQLVSDTIDVTIIDTCVEGDRPEQWLPAGYTSQDRQTHYSYHHPEYGTVHLYESDVRGGLPDPEDVSVGTVFHLAAVVGGRTSIEGEPLRLATDLSIDAELFNWAVSAEPDRLLYASSSAAYPTRHQNGDDVRKLSEDLITFDETVGTPDMIYGWAKLTGEYLARFAAREYGLNVACVRPFSGYGGEQSFDYPIPAIARRAARQQDPLHVWGSGRQVRDFVHVDDCVTALRLAAREISDGSTVNIGSGRPTEFLEIAQRFAAIAEYEPEIEPRPEMPTGVEYRCADPTRMETVLNWTPEVELQRGLERVYQSVVERIDP